MSSSPGADSVAEVIYLDAFVPEDGQSMLDMVDAERRAALEHLVATEGDGWLLPRIAPPPWDRIVEGWSVTDPADRSWVLGHLRPTPFGHFTASFHRTNPAAASLPRTYIRCTSWPAPVFDKFADHAVRTPGWRRRDLNSSHIPFITSPNELASLLHELTMSEAHA